MSKVSLAGNASGTGIFTIASPNSNTDRTLTLPDSSGTISTTGQAVTRSQLPAGTVLQVVTSAVRTATNDTTSTSPIEISTDYRVTITPISTSSKILVMFFGHFAPSSGAFMALAFYRSIGGGAYAKANAGNGDEAFRNPTATGLFMQSTLMHLDSPSTTSACIYTPYFWNSNNSNNIRVNDNPMGSFTLAMEIAA
jgi:hypothetical protein